MHRTALFSLFIICSPQAQDLEFVRGNANGDAVVDLSDAVSILGSLDLVIPEIDR